MQKRQNLFLGLWFIVSLGFLLLLGSAVCAQAKTITLATLNWEPYVGENIEAQGFTSEIVKEAFISAGYKVKIVFLPWARVLAEVESGKYDAMYPAYYSDQRAEIYALSEPIASGPLVFYKRTKQQIKYRSLLDLKHYRIGIVQGYVNTPAFDSADYLQKDVTTNDKLNLLKLLKGRVDLIVIDKYTAQYIIATSIPKAIGKLEYIDPPLENKSLYVGFSRKNKKFKIMLDDFNHALNQLYDNGIIDMIMEKHGFE